MSNYPLRAAIPGVVALLLVTAAAGCAAAVVGTPTAGPSSAPTTVASTPAAVSPTDAQVCGDVERLGERFYTKTFAPLIMQPGTNASTNVTPIELSAQLAALTTIGSEPGELDGSDAIAAASPGVSSAMITMVRDADRLAQRFADASVSGVVVGSDVTPIVNSFTDALIACTQAGYQPTWFDPEALVAN